MKCNPGDAKVVRGLGDTFEISRPFILLSIRSRSTLKEDVADRCIGRQVFHCQFGNDPLRLVGVANREAHRVPSKVAVGCERELPQTQGLGDQL